MLRKPGGAERESKERVFAAWRELRASLEAAKPDVLVVFGTDHFETFSYDFMPIFTLGRGDGFESWGEFGSPKRRYRGVAELSDFLHRAVIADGFDVAGAVELPLDHSYSCPLEYLSPDGRIPIVPVTVTSFVPPEPPLTRCVALGRSLHAALRRQEIADRVAVLGTGAISHWIGVPETGRINPEFDRAFLDWFESAALDEPGRWSDDDYLLSEGGRGSYEIRCWVAAAAAAGTTGGRRLVYEPVADWLTGISLVELEPAR
jgi:aromatic ring-opening dioxygenase catalytic subunit (LigB family)